MSLTHVFVFQGATFKGGFVARFILEAHETRESGVFQKFVCEISPFPFPSLRFRDKGREVHGPTVVYQRDGGITWAHVTEDYVLVPTFTYSSTVNLIVGLATA